VLDGLENLRDRCFSNQVWQHLGKSDLGQRRLRPRVRQAEAVCSRRHTGTEGPLLAQMRSARCPLFGRYEGKSGRRGHRVFVDTEVIRGGPLLELAGHGREAWRAAAGPRGCCGRHFFPAHNPRAALPRQKPICDNQSHYARENQQCRQGFSDHWPRRMARSR